MQSFDDVPGRDGPGTSEHDVERLVALVVTELRVRVAIDGFQCPLGILELHLCVLLLLWVHLLLALPLGERHAILVLLLHLFTELFHELLDLPALRRAMERGVVHGALRAAVITIGRLTGTLVAFRPATTPTRLYSYGSGRSSQRLVAASLLLFPVVAVVAAWGLGPPTGEYQAWPSAALAHLSARSKSAETS
jgi:hypothetical protein